jgi:hypothetical protein
MGTIGTIVHLESWMTGSRYPKPVQVTASHEVRRGADIIRSTYIQALGIIVAVYFFRKRKKEWRVYLSEIGDRVSISIQRSQCVNFL